MIFKSPLRQVQGMRGMRQLLGMGQNAANGLLNNLIAYWPGNEASGDAFDVHTNALKLTNVNTVTSNPGKVYALARQYTRANLERHTRLIDDALLSTGGADFTIAQWLYMDSKPAGSVMIGSQKWSGLQQEWWLAYDTTTDRFQFVIGGGGTAVANTFGAPNIGVWYLVISSYDSGTNTASIQVNNGDIDSAASAPPSDSTAALAVGFVPNAYYWDGRMHPTMFWKSAPGGGGVLDAMKRSLLWNGGAGLPYASFTL